MSPSAAQVTPTDAYCRADVEKATRKLTDAALQAMDYCIAGQLHDRFPGNDCNDPTPGNTSGADIKLKVQRAAASLTSKLVGVGTVRCTDAGNGAVLDALASCPSPGELTDDGGDSLGIDTFPEVAACQTALSVEGLRLFRDSILRPDVAAVLAHPNVDEIVDCGRAISKTTAKLWREVSKRRGRCQVVSDDTGGPYEYVCSNDNLGRIADYMLGVQFGMDRDCALLPPAELALLRSCTDDAGSLADCLITATLRSAGGLTAAKFANAGVCPTSMQLVSNPVRVAGAANALDAGWRGDGHDVEYVSGFPSRLSLTCADGDCAACSVAATCEDGNCRCSHDMGVACNEPFVEDVCGPGNTCVLHLTPPLPLNANGLPLCALNGIGQPPTGTADVGRGALAIDVQLTTQMHGGIAHEQPCPICDAGAGPQVGDLGTCEGGPDDGEACTVHAVHPTFGAVSFECEPAGAIGRGLSVAMTLTSGSSSLPFGDACDGPLVFFDCACGGCENDPTLACRTDADCPGLTGPCGNGDGLSRAPNQCSDLVCTAVGDGEGECAQASDTLTFCDGITQQDGRGILPCADSSECAAVGPQWGGCGISEQRSCFLDPITADGVAGSTGGVLVSTACVPPSGAGLSLDQPLGLPGALRTRIGVDTTMLCPDGLTPFELGGSVCPVP